MVLNRLNSKSGHWPGPAAPPGPHSTSPVRHDSERLLRFWTPTVPSGSMDPPGIESEGKWPACR
eukprot:768265-Hanusia_phi.AAC.4